MYAPYGLYFLNKDIIYRSVNKRSGIFEITKKAVSYETTIPGINVLIGNQLVLDTNSNVIIGKLTQIYRRKILIFTTKLLFKIIF